MAVVILYLATFATNISRHNEMTPVYNVYNLSRKHERPSSDDSLGMAEEVSVKEKAKKATVSKRVYESK